MGVGRSPGNFLRPAVSERSLQIRRIRVTGNKLSLPREPIVVKTAPEERNLYSLHAENATSSVGATSNREPFLCRS